MKKLVTLTALSIFVLLPTTARSRSVASFVAIGTVQAVKCVSLWKRPGTISEMPPTPVGPEKWAQCTVVLYNRSGGRALRSPILCLDDMARSCAALAQGDPAMIFGINLRICPTTSTSCRSYRLAKHVGIEIKSGREAIAAAAAQGARKKRRQ